MTFTGPPVCSDPSCSKAGKRHYPPHNHARNPLAAFVSEGIVEVPCAKCECDIAKGELYVVLTGEWQHLRCVGIFPDEILTCLKATAETQYPKPVTYPLPGGESALTVRWSPPLRNGKPHRASINVPAMCYVWEVTTEWHRQPQPLEPGDIDALRFLNGMTWPEYASICEEGATGVYGRADGVLDT